MRGGVGNPRGLTVSVDPGHVAGQVSPGVDTYVMHVMQYVMQYVMLSTRGSEFDPGHTTGRVSPRGFPTPPRTGASVMSTSGVVSHVRGGGQGPIAGPAHRSRLKRRKINAVQKQIKNTRELLTPAPCPL